MTYRKVKRSDLVEGNKEQLEKYECPKCEHILTDAVQTSCGHWLCHDCADGIFKKMKGTPYCPRVDCGEELTSEEGRPFFPDRFVRKEIGRFVVACINHKFGCSWEEKLSELGNHLGNCEHNKTECQHCNQAFSPLEYQSHVDQCPKKTVTCPLKDHGCETEEVTKDKSIQFSLSKYDLLKSNMFLPVANPKSPETRRYISTFGPDPRRNHFGFSNDRVVRAVGGYQEMGGGKVDDKLMSLVMTKITGIQAELTKKDSQIHTLQDKVAQLEKKNFFLSDVLNEIQTNFLFLRKKIFDGSMVWKIPQFSQRMDDARTGKYTSIFSPPFYSSRYGYKMCLRLYILGDGIGKGTHMSLFFVVMKGEFDSILQWPFTHKVTFKLINQCGARDIMDIFQPDPLSSSFQKPKSDMNVASGCPRFVSMNELMQDGFVVDDTIFIKVKVDTTTMRHP